MVFAYEKNIANKHEAKGFAVMKQRKISYIWLALFAISVFCVLLWFAKTQARFHIVDYKEIYSSNGVWDLTDIDFETAVVRLIGNVQSIENEILTPEQFAQNEHKIKIDDPIDHNEGRTVRLKLLMPSEEYYSIYTSGDYARAVFINGQLRGSIGTPATNAEEFVPQHGAVEVDAIAQDSVLEIVVQGGNFVHRGGSTYTYMFVGSNDSITRFTDIQSSIEMLMVGMLYTLFIVHLLFASVLKNKALNFCFSILCFVFSLRLSLVGSKVLYNIFNDMSWNFAIKLEYLTVPVSSILLLMIVYMQFKDGANKHVIRFLMAIFYAFCAVFLVADTYTNSFVILALNVVHFFAIIYCMYVIINLICQKIKAKERIDRVQKITVVSFLFFSYATISDAFYYSGIRLLNIQSSLVEVASVTFAIFEALAIFYTTMKSVQAAKNAEREALSHAKNLENLNKMKTEFLQDMSHEMRTPLTVISTGMDYAYRQVQKPEIPVLDTLETIDIIRDETARLGRMVGGMVDMTTLSVLGMRQKQDFGEILNNCIHAYSLLVQKNDTEIIVDIPKDLPFVYIDSDSYTRVVNNIINNAMRHTKGGSISISAKAGEMYVTVNITDTGEGIDKELLQNVTRRGVSASGSMGIGLFICKTVVTSHGGELVIDSEEKKGTSVTFTIPVYGGQEEGHKI